MKKDWYDKYGKEFHCTDCTFLDSCLNKDAPLCSKCCEQYLRDRIADLEAKLAEKELNDWKDGTIICKWTNTENKVKELEQQLEEKDKGDDKN